MPLHGGGRGGGHIGKPQGQSGGWGWARAFIVVSAGRNKRGRVTKLGTG